MTQTKIGIWRVRAQAGADRRDDAPRVSEDRLGPIVLDEVKKRTLPHVVTRIVPTDPATQPRLRGAVTLVVQQHFGVPINT